MLNVLNVSSSVIVPRAHDTDLASAIGACHEVKLIASKGNALLFTGTAPAGAGSGEASVVLYAANVSFYWNGTRMDLDIENSGTSDATIIQVYIRTPSSATDNQTIVPVSLAAASTVQRIALN